MKLQSTRYLSLSLMATLIVFSISCGKGTQENSPDKAAKAPTNRIALTQQVQENLGVTWAKAELGTLKRVLDVSGEIIALPSHSWEIHAPLNGTLLRIAKPWQEIAKGDVIAEISSPALAEWQERLYEARAREHEAEIDLIREQAEVEPTHELAKALTETEKDSIAAVSMAKDALEQGRRLAAASKKRAEELKDLRKSDAVSAATYLDAKQKALEHVTMVTSLTRAYSDARIHQAEHKLKAAGARVKAEERAEHISLLKGKIAAAKAHYSQHVRALAALCGLEASKLLESENGVPRWTKLQHLALRSPADGVVIAVSGSTSSWIEQDETILKILDPSVLRFRALLPESDLKLIPEEFSVEVSIPGIDEMVEGENSALRPLADRETRSIQIETDIDNSMGTIKVGTSAQARIVLSEEGNEEILIPRACMVRDGIELVVFLRDPADHHQVIRTPVSIGAAAGGFVEIIAGVGEGDSLVLAGAHQLQQTGLGKSAVKGHFHADGTFHEGDH